MAGSRFVSDSASVFKQRPVIAVVTTQPTTPSAGDYVILGANPSGTEWDNFSEHDLVLYNGSSWEKTTPTSPMVVFLVSADKLYWFSGTSWDAL